MNKLDLQKIIREEIKKSLNENYRDAKENVAILHAMLKKGGKEAKYVKDLFKDIKSELSIIMSTTDAKANLKLANKVPELDEYLDDAVENALDDGMGRVKGSYSMSGMREATVKKDDLDKIGDFIMSMPQFERLSTSKMKAAIKDMHAEWKAVAKNYKSIEAYFEEIEETGGEEAFMENTLTEATGMNVTVSVPNLFVKAFKKFLAESKRDSEKGDTYYEITPGKEAALYSRLFSEWVKINFNALDEYELMDNFDSDLELEDEGGFAAILAKNGLLTKKIK